MNSFYSCGPQHDDEKCHFGHFNLREATAYVLCHNEVEFDNCRITISFQGVETSMRERNQEYRLLNQQPESRNMKNGLNLADTDRVKTEQITDDARYTLHLSLGGKTINYNGFNGRGYSSCCSLEGMGHCEWEGDSLMVRECDLFRRLDDDSWDSSSEDAPVVKGSVSKPLHTLVPGNGSVQLEFYHDTVALGKLRIPFEVLAEDLNPEQFAAPLVAQDILESNESTAAAAVALVAVPDDNKEHMERYVNKKIKKKRTEDENMAREEL